MARLPTKTFKGDDELNGVVVRGSKRKKEIPVDAETDEHDDAKRLKLLWGVNPFKGRGVSTLASFNAIEAAESSE